MALTITKLKMWKDPGYTRGCLEVPPAGSKKLPTPDYTSAADETLRPHKGSTLTELHLPLSFTECFDMSYLYIEASDGKGSVSLFGWIDSVTQRSTSAEGITILWSVDWWRSYSGSVTWGAGRIRRCTDSGLRRPIGLQPRYRTAASILDIETDYNSKGLMWVILSYRDNTSKTRLLMIPVSTINPLRNLYLTVHDDEPGSGIPDKHVYAPSMSQCLSGELASLLGIQSTAIDGAWISPVCPLKSFGYNPLNPDEIEVLYADYRAYESTVVYSGSTKYGAFTTFKFNDPSMISSYVKTKSLGTTRQTDDLITYAVTDSYGNSVGTLPYGMPVDNVGIITDVGNITANLRLCFYSGNTPNYGKSNAEGLTITIPLTPIPVASSAYSDYVVSGQKDYEYEQRSIQNQQKAVQGASGALAGAAGGAVLGAVAGSIVPVGGNVVGGALGAVAGALASGGTQAISAGVTYAIDEMIYKDKLQGLEDQRYSNQAGNMMIPGDGMGWLVFYKTPKFISLTADTQSQNDINNHIAQEGYPCDSPVSDVTSFITAGGALQIMNLMITGSIPPVAKRTIKSLLEGGVRIIENNPSGVTP